VDVARPVGETVAAFTDERQVTTWLAEHAEIDLANGVYTLAGPSIPGAPDLDSAHMELLSFDDGAQLRFRWHLLDDDTTVKMTFSPGEAGAHVAIEHAGISEQEWAWTVAGFWATVTENLRAWAERRVVGPRLDFRELVPGDIEVSAEIDAPASEVFRAIAEPAMVQRWTMSDNVTIEPEVGGTYDVGWEDDGPVKIVDLEPDRQLSYSWHSKALGYETLVTWDLAESAGKTRLTLVHSGFAPDSRQDSYRSGWHNFLVQIKYLVEEGDAWQPLQWDIVDAVPV
jgi:uncharacterized protein YndB with AHSA1/START domain